MPRKLFFIILGIFPLLFASCGTQPPTATPTPLPPAPTATEILPTPTPTDLGQTITWGKLQVWMLQVEMNTSYLTDFGSQRLPSPGQKFLWIQVRLKNNGTDQLDLPTSEHFSALYAKTEFKPTYGHRQDAPDYTALDPALFPGQEVSAWLRFDLPETAELKNVWFVFLPESEQIGASPASPNFPWGGEHPVFVWECGK